MARPRKASRCYLYVRLRVCGEWQEWYVTTDGEMDRARAIELATQRTADLADKTRKEYRVVDLAGAVVWPETARPYVTYSVIGDKYGGGTAWKPPTVNRRQAIEFLRWEYAQHTTGLTIEITRYSPIHPPRYSRAFVGKDGTIIGRRNETP